MPNLARSSSKDKEVKPKFIETELGREKLCIQCQEYWPLDSEFWFSYQGKPKKNGLRSINYEAVCKCCYYIRYKPQRSKTPKNRIRSGYERIGVV